MNHSRKPGGQSIAELWRGSHDLPLLVQNWDHTPGNTKVLPCLHYIACLTESDQAPKFPLAVKPAQVTMTNREVTFPDEQNKPTRIVIR